MGSKPGQGAKAPYARGTAKHRNKKLYPEASPPPRSGKYPIPPLPGREWTGKIPDPENIRSGWRKAWQAPWGYKVGI